MDDSNEWVRDPAERDLNNAFENRSGAVKWAFLRADIALDSDSEASTMPPLYSSEMIIDVIEFAVRPCVHIMVPRHVANLDRRGSGLPIWQK